MLTGTAWKAGGEVHMHFPSIWKALEAMKRQDGLGAWKANLEDSVVGPSYFESYEVSEKEERTGCISNLGKLACSWNGYLEFLQRAEEVEIAWCTSKRSVSFHATIRQRDGSRRKF